VGLDPGREQASIRRKSEDKNKISKAKKEERLLGNRSSISTYEYSMSDV
jgi:hypothetical protein